MKQLTVAELIVELQKHPGDLPVFANVESSPDWPIIRVVGYDNGVSVEFENVEEDQMKLVVNVSEKFEPGAESLGDFVRKIIAELIDVAEKFERTSMEFDGDLRGAVKSAECALVEVEGEY